MTQPRPQAQFAEMSHNLVGQRLGRKGLETRERIVAAALRLLGSDRAVPVTLTSVAREAAVGMTTLYLYFPDLGDLILAVLGRVMDSAEAAFVDGLRDRWPDDRLEECSLDFLRAHLLFWQRHARVLHLRNSFADGSDTRFLDYRNQVSRPLLDLLIRQMDDTPDEPAFGRYATVLLTGFERLATVVTNSNWDITAKVLGMDDNDRYIDELLEAEAEIIAIVIARRRADVRRSCAPASAPSCAMIDRRR